MAPPSQELEPPINPGRFKAAGGAVPQNVNFGVSSGTAVNFLGTIRSGIDPEVSLGGSKLEPETIAEMAMKFTVQISCD